jgi:hypothetical protein
MGARRPPVAAVLAAAVGALAGLSAPAAACPYCSLSQGNDTLVYIAAFVLLPYAIVSCVLLWIRRILRAERS